MWICLFVLPGPSTGYRSIRDNLLTCSPPLPAATGVGSGPPKARALECVVAAPAAYNPHMEIGMPIRIFVILALCCLALAAGAQVPGPQNLAFDSGDLGA